ncbi:MAG: FAD-binding oxidoreductase [Nitrososphaerota archaeon]|nr:FAD-binding oxidoreductase [Nitrososphaerota archaeon]MDG6939352.1 FAD-binding oxidoreductase [Nitrososphaerota archaeon]
MDAKSVSALKRIVGSRDVLLDAAALAGYARTACRVGPRGYRYRTYAPSLVVRPESTEEVSRVVAFARLKRIPVYVESGGTDTVGGSAPVKRGLMVDMRKMNKVLELSEESMFVTVQAGAGLQELEDLLRGHRLTHGHRPASFQQASVAGSISHYGVGGESPGFGLLADNVLGMAAVLPDGQVLRVRGVNKSSMGEKNLMWLLMGAQGEHGIITEVTLKLHPHIEGNRRLMMFGFDTFRRAMEASLSLAREGFRPTHQSATTKASLQRFVPSLAELAGTEGILSLILDGPRLSMVEAQIQELELACREMGGRPVPAPTVVEWRDHRSARVLERTLDRRSEFSVWTSFLKAQDFLAFPDEAGRMCEAHGASLAGVAFNSHPWTMILRVSAKGLSQARAGRCMYEILSRALEMGGTADAFHGPALASSYLAEPELGACGLETLRKVKRALDPAGVMNPGKAWASRP